MDVFRFSRKGDQGVTSLLSGERVSKASLRPEAYGVLDEASSVLGMAKVFTQNEDILRMVGTVQEDLLVLGAELASVGEKSEEAWRIGSDRTARLEAWIAELQLEAPLPRRFVLPGGNAASASLDLARTIIRRAERRVVALKENGDGELTEVLRYLNRLADFLFTLARYAEKKG